MVLYFLQGRGEKKWFELLKDISLTHTYVYKIHHTTKFHIEGSDKSRDKILPTPQKRV